MISKCTSPLQEVPHHHPPSAPPSPDQTSERGKLSFIWGFKLTWGHGNITHIRVWIWTLSGNTQILSKAREQSGLQLWGASSFPLFSNEYREWQHLSHLLFWFGFTPFSSLLHTLKLPLLYCCLFFPPSPSLFDLQCAAIIMWQSLFSTSIPSPSLSPLQLLNTTSRNNCRRASTPHPQVAVPTNPSHHCTSYHWYHDDCLCCANAWRQHQPTPPSLTGQYSLCMF